MNNRIVNAAILGAVVGFGLGYAFGRRRSSAEFEEAVEKESATHKEYYRKKRIEMNDEIVSARTEASEALAALATYQGVQALEEAATEVAQNETEEILGGESEVGPLEPWTPAPVKLGNSPAPDSNAVHKPKRDFVDRSKPYVISVEDFLNGYSENPGDAEYSQSTLTYYMGDDTLADDRDKIMDDASRLLIVGTHLSDFGVMSNDPNAVYIRNHKLHSDFEVVKRDDKYSEVVAGLGGNE